MGLSGCLSWDFKSQREDDKTNRLVALMRAVDPNTPQLQIHRRKMYQEIKPDSPLQVKWAAAPVFKINSCTLTHAHHHHHVESRLRPISVCSKDAKQSVYHRKPPRCLPQSAPYPPFPPLSSSPCFALNSFHLLSSITLSASSLAPIPSPISFYLFSDLHLTPPAGQIHTTAKQWAHDSKQGIRLAFLTFMKLTDAR
jgi:hypothetical protein